MFDIKEGQEDKSFKHYVNVTGFMKTFPIATYNHTVGISRNTNNI